MPDLATNRLHKAQRFTAALDARGILAETALLWTEDDWQHLADDLGERIPSRATRDLIVGALGFIAKYRTDPFGPFEGGDG